MPLFDACKGFRYIWQAIDDNAKGRMRIWLSFVVLCRPCCAQQAIALFTSVGLFLCMVVEVAVLVAVVAVLFCYLWQAIIVNTTALVEQVLVFPASWRGGRSGTAP